MMKRKFIAPLIALLLCVSMIGVGFAGWVITATTNATAEGNFTVYTVSDYRLNFTAQSESIIFGKPGSGAAESGKWLSYDQEVAQENLTPTITLSFTNFDVNKFKGRTITFSVGNLTYSDGNVTDAVAGYCVAFNRQDTTQTVTLTVDNNGTVNASTGAMYQSTGGNTATLTFDLASKYVSWGQATNFTNPYTFFGSGIGVDDPFAQGWDTNSKFVENIKNGDAALQILTEISEIASAEYSTTISCTITKTAA